MKEIQRIVLKPEEVSYHSYNPESFCQHPDGSFLRLYSINSEATLETNFTVQRLSSDLEHIDYLDIDIHVHVDTDTYHMYAICCTDAGEVVVASDHNLYLYRISNGRLRRIYSTSLEYDHIDGVSSYRNQIYVNTFENIIILDANLNINKTIDLNYVNNFESTCEIVSCSLHSYFSLTIGDFIYCDDTKLKQIKYLRQEDFIPVRVCLATDDSVFIIGKQEERARILQVNSDMNVLLDLLVSVETDIDILGREMIFDRVKNRIILYRRRDILTEDMQLTVIELE